jgi:hypothetical protein
MWFATRAPAFAGFVLTLAAATPATATTFSFTTDPFAGTTVLTTPGRQIVGGEAFINFNSATDVFAFNPTEFGINQILFHNGVFASVPASGVNVIVLEMFDNDANPATPFGAGNAADLLAAQITTSGPGFFVYFNSGLNLPRLVYSTDLSENTADLKVIVRMTNLTGQSAELANFTQANFALTETPVPGSFVLFSTGLALFAWRRLAWSRSRR